MFWGCVELVWCCAVVDFHVDVFYFMRCANVWFVCVLVGAGICFVYCVYRAVDFLSSHGFPEHDECMYDVVVYLVPPVRSKERNKNGKAQVLNPGPTRMSSSS